jgi:hypothetical protein
MKIRSVGVLGAGLMGAGIAEVVARSGHETRVREVSPDLAAKGLARIEASFAKGVERQKMTAEESAAARGRLTTTTDLSDLADCDFVIEAIVENLDLKKQTFGELDRLCKRETIFCSNTSSLTITELAASTARPDRFAGLHFFNPVPVMKLVEVVETIATSPETRETVFEFAKALGKEPIRTRDNSGFIVNRLLVPYLPRCRPGAGRGDRHEGRHRSRHGARLRVPDGPAEAARLRRPRHHLRDRGDHVRRVPRGSAFAPPASPQAHGPGGAVRAQVGPRLLRVRRQGMSAHVRVETEGGVRTDHGETVPRS